MRAEQLQRHLEELVAPSEPGGTALVAHQGVVIRASAAAGIPRPEILDRAEVDLPQRARGYRPLEDGFRLWDYKLIELARDQFVEPLFATTGAGGVVWTASGLYHWVRAFLDGRLIPAELVELALTPQVPASGLKSLGDTEGSGLGWLIADWRGRRLAWQDGFLLGHRSLLAILPDDDLVVVLLANRSDIDLHLLAEELLGESLR